MTAHGSEKLALRDQIAALSAQVATWTHGGNKVVGFDWPVEFAEVFTGGGFDIVLANPPYVRADAQFKHIDDEVERQAAISEWKTYCSNLLKSKIYQTLYEKWDLYLPFLERAYQLLAVNGRMVFIISAAYNAAKYAQKSHEFFLNNASIERIDFCTDIPLFQAGISNTIVHFAKTVPDSGHQPLRVRRWGESPDDFEKNTDVSQTFPQKECSTVVFRLDRGQGVQTSAETINLGNICYISYGLRANADDRYWQGEFTTDDCLSAMKDTTHPKPFVQGKDLVKWWVRRIWYLEWGTDRAPSRFSRPTFSELHEATEKLVAVRTPGVEPKVIYDADCLHFDASSVGFIPWYCLVGVRNKSIQKTAKYRDEVKRNEAPPAIVHEDLEEESRRFPPKYLLAIMNSSFTRDWLAARRRSKLHVYPDDWKPLPIVPATAEEQAATIALVDEIIALYAKHGYPLTPEAQSRLRELEQQIDKSVAKLYEG